MKHVYDEYGLCFECDQENKMLFELTESEAAKVAIAIQEHRNHHQAHNAESVADELDDLLTVFERQYHAQRNPNYTLWRMK